MHWRRIAPVCGRILSFLVYGMWPLVVLSQGITRLLAKTSGAREHHKVDRDELAALTHLAQTQGVFDRSESRILTNLFRMGSLRTHDIMTPRTVMFTMQEDTPLETTLDEKHTTQFSRIPLWRRDRDDVVGYVLKDELLLRLAEGEFHRHVGEFRRDLVVVPASLSVTALFEQLLDRREQIALVVDEYGGVEGVVTMEDVIETVLGLEIVDEADTTQDMREMARAQWYQRATRLGLVPPESEPPAATSSPPPEAMWAASSLDPADAMGKAARLARGPSMSRWARWRYALKIASWPKLWVPALLGQAVGAMVADRFDRLAFIVGAAFTTFDVVYIVMWNDWGDQEVDRIKRRMFRAQCSKKTIPDGILSSRTVFWAGAISGIAAVATGVIGEWGLSRPGLGVFGLLCLGMLAAYTLPPFRLNYRGGGELLEMVGVGFALPVFHAYLQGGVAIPSLLWAVLPGSVLLGLASAIASGLSDEESDRAGGKHTIVTRWGNRAGRRLTEALVVAGSAAWGLSAVAPTPLRGWVAVAPIVTVGWYFAKMRRVSDQAVTGSFSAQSEYKQQLHRAIWYGTLCLIAGLWVDHLAMSV